MRIYVVGPVTGIEDGNRPAFEEAAAALHSAGYSACIPHWFIPAGTPWEIAMRRSVEMLVKHDAVATLPGFSKSRGAAVEVALAAGINMPVKSVAEWEKGAGR